MGKSSVTEAQIRQLRDGMPFGKFDYNLWLDCQIALGNRSPRRGEAQSDAAARVAAAWNARNGSDRG